ncbi:hypothetical protein NMV45_11360, partial [Pasteurella multocida]|nr:hypothetical protein [Pasteurella multocida]MDY0596011.1 hypothetical protein [Pasteurella multocida]MDY0633242.1 hypothetical protein [Pasteurella multocida]MDY0665433.1 hypothetical protein [Pasteurella multocida]MDY0667544.1 hypothetical protein [Pasteurella multocida]
NSPAENHANPAPTLTLRNFFHAKFFSFNYANIVTTSQKFNKPYLLKKNEDYGLFMMWLISAVFHIITHIERLFLIHVSPHQLILRGEREGKARTYF